MNVLFNYERHTLTDEINIYNIFIKLYPNFNECSYDRADESGELKKRYLDIRSKIQARNECIHVCTMQFCKIGNVNKQKNYYSY